MTQNKFSEKVISTSALHVDHCSRSTAMVNYKPRTSLSDLIMYVFTLLHFKEQLKMVTTPDLFLN